MKKDIDTLVKEYFSSEVAARNVPPFPLGRKKKSRIEHYSLAALFAASLFCLMLPRSYDNSLRKDVYISFHQMDEMKKDLSLAVFTASQEYYKSKGVKND